VATYTCDLPHEHVTTMHGVQTFEELTQHVNAQGLLAQKPILFKQFLTTPDHQMQQIKALHGDTKVVFTNVSMESFGNTWMGGIR
jgi:hypothetical protein